MADELGDASDLPDDVGHGVAMPRAHLDFLQAVANRGSMERSAVDRALKARLQQALAPVDIRTLDHIIVAGIDALAFVECRLI